jgi:hypothetical protein
VAKGALTRLLGLAALVLAAWLLVRPGVAEARRRIVVLELQGDRAEDFQDELEKFLKKSHSLVPRKKWIATAEDLRATKVTDKNVKKVARELAIDGVITGTVEKRGSRYYLRLTLRAGTDGKTVTTTELVERAPRFSAEGRATLGDELLGAIDELESMGDDGDEDADEDDDRGFGRDDDDDDADDDGGRRLTAKEKAARDKAAKEKAAKEKAAKEKAAKEKAAREKAAREKARRDRDRRRDDDEDFDEDEIEMDDDGGRGRDRVADAGDDEEDEAPVGRRRDDDAELEGDAELDLGPRDPRARPFDLSAGLSFTARRLSFQTDLTMNAPLGYKSNPVPGFYVGADLYPLAFNRKNRSLTRNLGLTFVFDRVIKIESQIQQGGMVYELGTTEQHLGVGALYRHLIGAKLSVAASVRYNKRKFVIDRAAAAMPDAVDIPDVSYTYLDPALGLRYLLGPKVAFGADLRYLIVTDTGTMKAADQYGGAKVSGFDLGGRLDYQVGRSLLVRAALGMTRIAFTFDGDGTLSNNRDGDASTRDVSGATDLYFGGALTGVYMF